MIVFPTSHACYWAPIETEFRPWSYGAWQGDCVIQTHIVNYQHITLADEAQSSKGWATVYYKMEIANIYWTSQGPEEQGNCMNPWFKTYLLLLLCCFSQFTLLSSQRIPVTNLWKRREKCESGLLYLHSILAPGRSGCFYTTALFMGGSKRQW